jgi:hypothetical protein
MQPKVVSYRGWVRGQGSALGSRCCSVGAVVGRVRGNQMSRAYALTQDGGGSQAGTVQGLRGLLRDSDDFVGADVEELQIDVTQGSSAIKSAQPSGFLRRTAQDVLTGAGIASETVVLSRDSTEQLTLAAPWTAPSGRVSASFHHDQANYCVHFSMVEGD